MRAVGERTFAILICLAVLGMGDLEAQQTPRPLKFEVASVQEVSPNAAAPYRIDPAGLTISGSLRILIIASRGLLPMQVEGGPAWTSNTWFQIQARTPSASTKAQIMEMLQTLLADRFHLVVQRRVKMESGYALVVDKGGPKLPPLDEPPPATRAGSLLAAASGRTARRLSAWPTGSGRSCKRPWLTRQRSRAVTTFGCASIPLGPRPGMGRYSPRCGRSVSSWSHEKSQLSPIPS